MSKTRLWYVGCGIGDHYYNRYSSQNAIVVSDKPRDDVIRVQKIRTITPRAAARQYIKHNLLWDSVAIDNDAYGIFAAREMSEELVKSELKQDRKRLLA